MGTVIAKTAAADDIVRDAQTTHEQGVEPEPVQVNQGR